MNALNSRVSVNRDQKYCIPKEVQPVDLHGRIQLTTFEGGRIWIDLRLFRLWEAAEGKSLNELMSDPRFLGWGDNQILSGIICLVEVTFRKVGMRTHNSRQNQCSRRVWFDHYREL